MVSTASNKLILHSINVEIFLFLLVRGLAGVCQDQSDDTAATAMYLEASNNFVDGLVTRWPSGQYLALRNTTIKPICNFTQNLATNKYSNCSRGYL